MELVEVILCSFFLLACFPVVSAVFLALVFPVVVYLIKLSVSGGPDPP